MSVVNRNTIIDSLVPYFENDERYFLLVCDCGFAKIDKLQRRFSRRIVNCGIMEQGTVGIAGGMVEAGLKPIIYSIATFIVFRALEQIRNDIVLASRNVKIIGNGCDDYFKELGSCHWCKDDDRKVLEIVGLPVYEGKDFDEWIESPKGGYIRV